jgi:hypothetical protein
MQSKRLAESPYTFYNCIRGFYFFDKDGALLWEIGETAWTSSLKKETVMLKENEVIVGVVAKLVPGW